VPAAGERPNVGTGGTWRSVAVRGRQWPSVAVAHLCPCARRGLDRPAQVMVPSESGRPGAGPTRPALR